MREAFRPYVKFVEITSLAPTTVSLTDSSGTAIDCNYIQVESVSGHIGAGGGDEFFLVIPNGPSSAEGEANFPDASGVTYNSASGIIGCAGQSGIGSVILSLAPSDKSNSIRLSHSNVTNHLYAITYGNVRVTNSFADNKLPTGN